MKFMLLIYGDEVVEAQLSSDEWQAVTDAHVAFGTAHAQQILAGEALEPTASAKTLRRVGGRLNELDGPFAETKEQLGGFFMVEAATVEDAAELAKQLRIGDHDAVEIRPIMEP
jgi:hypothetical protein